MNIYSYIVVSDDGFAPNPFHGICTLACCKPAIRRTCSENDYVIGLTPKYYGYKMIYAMKVTKKINFREYWNDYPMKRADKSTELTSRGDNVYRPSDECEDEWFLQPSFHSPKGYEDKEFKVCKDVCKDNTKDFDVCDNYVLISNKFIYYGSNAIHLPSNLHKALKVGRGHRKIEKNEDEKIFKEWEDFFTELRNRCDGLQGYPIYMSKHTLNERYIEEK